MNNSPSLQVTVIYNPEEKSTTDEVSLTDNGIQTTASTIANTLRQCGYETSIYPVSEKNLYYLKHKKADAFFNVCEASDLYMRVVKQLEKGGRVFTGPGPTVMALTVDKIATKRVFESMHVPTPAWQIFETGKEKMQSNLQFPLIVKPANEDCSIGITQQSIVRTEEALYARIQEIRGLYKQRVLVEEFIVGKELHCTVLGNGKDAVVLPIAELQFNDGHEDPEFIFDYEAKWVADSPNYQNTFVSPAPSVDERITKAIQRDAKRAFVALEMKDYARFDVRYNEDTKKWYFLEANANPSIQPRDEATTTSASAVGMGYHQFIQTIVESCTKRHAYVPLVATS